MRVERYKLDSDGAYIDAYIADPTKNFTRKAILVIPGGGYGVVCSDREGEPIAQAFMPYGYNAFVLNYYTGRKKPFPIQLVQTAKAIKHIKDNAENYGIDPNELFVVGFSAGGHLAASAGILWNIPEIYAEVEMPYGYNKPKGVMLVYPVIGDHKGCFQNLWATKEITEEMIDTVSVDKHVDKDSAPAFIMHTSNDEIVDVRNSLSLASAYKAAELQFELHVFPDAPHGAALGNKITSYGKPKYENSAIAEWVRMAAVWADSLS